MKFSKKINIGVNTVGEGCRVFIIAEAGVNHNGNFENAKKLVDIALEAGADGVKFQAFKTDNLILKDVKKAPYQTLTTQSGESQYEMLKKLEFSKAQNAELKKYCESKGILYLVTPFDDESLEEMDDLDLAAYKIASTDTTNLPFIKKVAAKHKPVILSTGMSFMAEVESAVKEIYPENKDLILLHCTANYPVSADEVNLNVMSSYKEKIDVIVGFSDHTEGIGASPYAVAAGAKMIEKHFTFDKDQPGPDHKASLSPSELKAFVKEIRTVEKYLGSEIKKPTLSEEKTRRSLQKCLIAKNDIKKGQPIKATDIAAKRTGGRGISPIRYKDVIGKAAVKEFKKDEVIEL